MSNKLARSWWWPTDDINLVYRLVLVPDIWSEGTSGDEQHCRLPRELLLFLHMISLVCSIIYLISCMMPGHLVRDYEGYFPIVMAYRGEVTFLQLSAFMLLKLVLWIDKLEAIAREGYPLKNCVIVFLRIDIRCNNAPGIIRLQSI